MVAHATARHEVLLQQTSSKLELLRSTADSHPPIAGIQRCTTRDLDALETGRYETGSEREETTFSVYELSQQARRAAMLLVNETLTFLQQDSLLPTSSTPQLSQESN